MRSSVLRRVVFRKSSRYLPTRGKVYGLKELNDHNQIYEFNERHFFLRDLMCWALNDGFSC